MSKSRKATKPDQGQLDVVLASLVKQFGEGVIQSFGADTDTKIQHQVPSGSISLDLALGVLTRRPNGSWQTGYPGGRIVEIFGPEQSGKTTLSLLSIANAQAAGGRAAFIDVEHCMDASYAKTLKVDLDNLMFSQPDSGDQAMQVLSSLVKSEAFSIIVVDSIAALATEAELSGEVTDNHVGQQARLMSQTLKLLTTHMGSDCKTVVLFTNQLRSKIGQMGYGNPETTPGGRAMRYYAGVRVDLRSIQKLKDQQEVPVGQRCKAVVVKNKVSAPYREAQFPLVFGYGVDQGMELLELCVAAGIARQAGAWYSYGDIRLGCGATAAAAFLRTDRALAYEMYDKLLTMAQRARGLNPDGTPIEGYEPPVHMTSTQQFAPPGVAA